ncbi:MFS transporter [Cellulomonas carbonis]|uniref:Major facilitator superfamily (MFS) profile domain-containing protein n=1 Tax=Cellulomonas carbonis T26 TaxID=947969 RepID=A0A0A0BND0_9CELL|nr:MFS transporter [Cellulomonas carbonis]KGM09430.1 hypothetical protein N868_02185 [Cellulomonas carbonis T26]GGB94973.1 MFS transporter [Cellulomonas carbonis]
MSGTTTARGARPRSAPPAPRFHVFWASQALAQVAGQTVLVVIPLLAVAQFDAGTREAGLLTFAQYVPVLVVTPFLGAVVDRSRKRPLMVAGHVGRGIALTVLGLATGAGVLNLAVLAAVVLVVGVLGAAFDVALQAYVASAVPRAELVRANSRLQGTLSLAQVVGPAVGGVVAGAGQPALGLFLIAATYLLSAALMRQAYDVATVQGVTAGSFLARTAEGFRYSWADPRLRLLLTVGTWFNLAEQAMITVFLVYSVREMGMSSAQVGTVMGVGALGAVAASVVSTRLAARVTRRTVLVVCMGLASLAPLGLAVAPPRSVAGFLVLAAVFFAYGCGVTAYNVQAMSYRQELASAEMQGRVGAVYRFFAYGALALGGLLAPALATPLGLRPALLCLAAVLVTGWAAFVVRSRVLR